MTLLEEEEEEEEYFLSDFAGGAVVRFEWR